MVQANASYNSYTENNNPFYGTWSKTGYVPENVFYKDGKVVKTETGGGNEEHYQKILKTFFGFE